MTEVAIHVFPAVHEPSAGMVERLLRAVQESATEISGALALAPARTMRFGEWSDARATPRFAAFGIAECGFTLGGTTAGADRLAAVLLGGREVEGGERTTPLTSAMTERFTRTWIMGIGAILGASIDLGASPRIAADAPCLVVPLLLGETAVVELCMPLRALATLEAALGAAAADPRWSSRLDDTLGTVCVRIRVVLARPTIDAGELARMRPGAVIPIPRPGPVALIAGGYRIGVAALSEVEGAARLTIEAMEI